MEMRHSSAENAAFSIETSALSALEVASFMRDAS
jgi:hypothetical protein